MKLFHGTFLVAALSTAVLVMASPRDPEDSGDRDVEWQPASAWEYTGLFTVGNHGIPSNYDPVLLSLGRSVYADLQQARQAALNKEAANLWVSLQEARETIHRLRLPSRLMALESQLRVIRNDLKDSGKALDEDLWVPVEAEIDEVLVYAPEEVKARTRAAVRAGRAAAGRGDRENAAAQLDVVTSSLKYSLGIFPLHEVERGLDTAEAAASLPKPDWAGALEAIQRMLAAFHWYTHAPTHGLLAAYNDMVSAYALASDPDFRPVQKQQVLDYLVKAEKNLRDTPGGEALAEETQALIGKGNAPASDIKLLLGKMQSQMRLEHQRVEGRPPDVPAHRPAR
jgi:hypothetical protein